MKTINIYGFGSENNGRDSYDCIINGEIKIGKKYVTAKGYLTFELSNPFIPSEHKKLPNQPDFQAKVTLCNATSIIQELKDDICMTPTVDDWKAAKWDAIRELTFAEEDIKFLEQTEQKARTKN